MAELRAYALAVAELRSIAGAEPPPQERLRALARTAFAPSTRPPHVRDLVGPIYRRVPGSPVLRDDEPTPADLDALLAGTSVGPARSPATWRLVEVLVAGLAWGSTRLFEAPVATGLLAPTGLGIAPSEGLVVGWCTREQAAAEERLKTWLTEFPAWSAAARHEGRPPPDVVAFGTR